MKAYEETTNLTMRTVDNIMDMISQRRLPAGEFFATETDLEQQLGVSRQIVREAVSRLKAIGYLASRQKIGLVTAKPDPIELFENALDHYMFDVSEERELGELRFALEVGAVEIAVSRATDEQIGRLQCCAERYDGLAERDPDRAEADLQFHMTILEASHNEFLHRMNHVIVRFFARRSLPDSPYHDHIGPVNHSGIEHYAIVRDFEDRNIERARMHLADHLRFLTGAVR